MASAAVAASLSSALAPIAHAQDPGTASPPTSETAVTANVVAIDGEDLIVDLGSSAQVAAGDLIEIWRPLKIKHPVTHRMVEDRFRIGTLKMTQIGPRLSLARAQGNLTRDPGAGDVVILRKAIPAAPPPRTVAPVPARRAPPAPGAQPQPPPTENPPPPVVQESECAEPLDPEAAELTRIFEALRGADPVARIRAYEDYVRKSPQGRFAPVLYEEAQALRILLQPSRRAAPCELPQPRIAQFEPPTDVRAEAPLSLGIELDAAVRGAVLHVRNRGEAAYKSLPMSPAAKGYFVATIPAERVQAPGLEYFLEATNDAGMATPIKGDAENPVITSVDPVPRPEPPAHHDATFALVTDYADYNRLRGNDYASQTEGWFGLRYNEVGVRALRSGFGVYRGAGGTVSDLDEKNLGPRQVGLTYGYLELEFGVSDFVSMAGRAVVGLVDDGMSGGGQAMLRIGNDRKTNLLLGGEFLGGVGPRGFTQLELNTFEKFPIILRSEVSNQPAGISDSEPRGADDRPAEEVSSDTGAIGARGIVQVGYRVLPSLVLSVRGSYQGRTINHSGPGAGAGVTYQW